MNRITKKERDKLDEAAAKLVGDNPWRGWSNAEKVKFANEQGVSVDRAKAAIGRAVRKLRGEKLKNG